MQLTIIDYVYILVEAVLCVLTIALNGIVLAALWRYPNLRTVTNCYIGSLAVADVLVGLFIVPVVLISYTGLPHHFYPCLVVSSFVEVFVTISILSIVSVALDRYWAVLHPVARLNVGTKQNALKIVLTLWTLGTVIGLVPLMGLHNGTEGFDACSFRRVIDLKYHVYLQLCAFRIPILLFMLYLFVRIYYVIKRVGKTGTRNALGYSDEIRSPGWHLHMFSSMVTIFTVYALCWLPMGIVNYVELWSSATPVKVNIMMANLVMTHFNTSINPTILFTSQPGFVHVIRQHIPARFIRAPPKKFREVAVIVKRTIAIATFIKSEIKPNTDLSILNQEMEPITHDTDSQPEQNDNDAQIDVYQACVQDVNAIGESLSMILK